MEIAFYILAASWVILLVVCIVLVVRLKNLYDVYDTSLDTVIGLQKTLNDTLDENKSLLNQLDAAEQNIDDCENERKKLQKTIDIMNERISKMKATKEDTSIIYVDKAYIEYITSAVHVSAELVRDIADGNLSANQVENSLRNNIERQIMNYLLRYAKYYSSYDIEFNSYNFMVKIPVIAENNPDWECYKRSQTPLTNILLDKVKEE